MIVADSTEIDRRIARLEGEQQELRRRGAQSASEVGEHLSKLELGQKGIELNLAQQDKTLARLDKCINGNGQPGLLIRLDRNERIVLGLVRLGWILVSLLTGLIAHTFWNRI